MPRNTIDSSSTGKQASKRELWLVDDVADYLQISKDAVYRMVARREIPHTRIFRRKGLRFHPDEVEKWARSVGAEEG
jgi:excisionase family DNA binding protein